MNVAKLHKLDIVSENDGLYDYDTNKFICPIKYYKQYNLEDHAVVSIEVDQYEPRYLKIVISN